MRHVIQLLLLIAATLIFAEEKTLIVSNPYARIHWASCGRYKANLHTHTRESDGALTPDEVIDRYVEKGTHILSLSDHNHFTWPWSEWGRDPDSLGIIAIPGMEASRHYHVNSLFCSYDGSFSDIFDSFYEIESLGGLSQFNHPGRNHEPASWYCDVFKKFPSLFALEVYNQGDRYPNDRVLWDSILTALMPNRPVWGTSNDDMHSSAHIGRNWQVVFTPHSSLTSSKVYVALQKGHFYSCYDPFGAGDNAVPIDSIKANRTSIKVYAKCPDSAIHWISNGKEVAIGPTVFVTDSHINGNYIRAEIYGNEEARTLTQPFGLLTPLDNINDQEEPLKPYMIMHGVQGSYLVVDEKSTVSGRVTLYALSGRLLFSARLDSNQVVPLPKVAKGLTIIEVDMHGYVRREKLFLP